MEGPAQHAWRPASSRCSLLGHLRSHSDLAHHEIFFDFVTDPRVAKSTTRLCHGLSTGPRRNAIVHAFAPGVQMRRNIKEDACTQVGAQCLQTEAGRSCME